MKQFRSRIRKSGNLISTRPVRSRAGKSPRVAEARPVARTVRSTREPKASPRKNPKILLGFLAQGQSLFQAYFETIGAEEVIRIFEESYCSSLVNFLLDLKKSTTKRIFEILLQAKKRTCLNVIAHYYYKEYMTNPFPLTLESEAGKEVPNHYAILGVPREISVEELKTAYKLLSSSFEADSFPPADRKQGDERHREIQEAFEVLRNPKKRVELDRALPNISYLYPRRDQSWLESMNRLGV